MNSIKRIAKNTSVLLISQIITYLIAFLYTIYSARYLGAEGFGILSFALALTTIFGILVELGLSKLTVREVARDSSLANKYIANTILIRAILAIITFGLIVLTVNLLNYPKQMVNVIYLIALYVIFTVFTQMYYSIFQAYEKMEFQSIGTILTSLLILGGILVAVYYKLDIIAFALIYLISSVITFIYAFSICTWKFFIPKIEFDLSFLKIAIKEAWPFMITGTSIYLYTYIDTIMLSMIKGNEAVGWYTASYKLILILLFIPIVFNTAIFPLMSQYHISSPQALKKSFEKLVKLMAFLGIPLGIGTVFIADKIVLLVYGEQYINSIIVLQILIWSTVLIFARSSFERLLESVDKQIVITKIFIIGVIFNILTNLIIIPKYSYIGAGIVTVLTDSIVLVLLIVATRYIGFNISKSTLKSLGKIIFASLIMGMSLKYLSNLNMLYMILISSIIYITLSLIFKIIEEDEILLISSIFKN